MFSHARTPPVVSLKGEKDEFIYDKTVYFFH